MEKYFLIVFAILLSVIQSIAQCGYIQNFESGWGSQTWRDTSQTKNVWQVGKPQKTIFTSAFSPTHVIVTDTINPYPINDTSSFYFIDYGSWTCGGYAIFDFEYKTNTDTLKDYGFIECSINKGKWFNLNDTLYKLGKSNSSILSGTTIGWQNFNVNLSTTLNIWDTDTILFKFTFISDSIQTNKDGWIIDNINVAYVVGVSEINQSFINSFAFPNPVFNSTTINYLLPDGVNQGEIVFYDLQGKELKRFRVDRTFDHLLISTSDIPAGTYFFQLQTSSQNSAGKKMVVIK